MQSLPIILVVEDDQLIQSVVEETPTEGGFEIDIASSAAQAIELLDKAGGKYRARVTDINLGRGQIDGWEIARHAAGNRSGVSSGLCERRQRGGLGIQGCSKQHHARQTVRARPTCHRGFPTAQQRYADSLRELIAAAFISAPNAEPVTDAKTRPTKMHLEGKSLMPTGPLFRQS
jgi:CheY-like chemotaxis protein